jgi:hypothetical protein
MAPHVYFSKFLIRPFIFRKSNQNKYKKILVVDTKFARAHTQQHDYAGASYPSRSTPLPCRHPFRSHRRVGSPATHRGADQLLVFFSPFLFAQAKLYLNFWQASQHKQI